MSSRTQDHDAQAQATGQTQRHTSEKTVFRSSQAAINCDEDIREKEVTIRLPRAAGEGGHMEPSLVPLGTAEARVKYIVQNTEYRIQNTVYGVHNSLLHILPSISYPSIYVYVRILSITPCSGRLF